MSLPDNYQVEKVSSALASIKIYIAWDFDGVDELFVWLQNTVDGTVYYQSLSDFTVTTDSDGGGVFILVENNQGVLVDVSVARTTPKTQNYDLSNGEALNPDALIATLNKTVKMIQEEAKGYDNQNITSVNPYVVPDKVSRAGKISIFDSNGDPDFDTPDNILAPQIGYAEEWATKAEDSLISVAAGGNGTNDFSSLHHSAKAADSASSASTFASNASFSEDNAQTSEGNAAVSEINAQDHEANAGGHEANAQLFSISAAASAQDAEDANGVNTAAHNIIIDGQFNHWDSGPGPFTSTAYGPTMWFLNNDGAGTGWERKTFSIGQTDVPFNPKYYMSCNNDATSTGIVLRQFMKDVSKSSGVTFTLSLWLKGTGSGDVNLRFTQNFGTGGSPSSSVAINNVTAITSSWAKYTVTVNMASVLGKTLGTNNNSTFQISIEQKTSFASFEGTLDYANISITEGNVPYNGSWPKMEEERERINPFYEVIGDYSEGVAGSTVMSFGMYNGSVGTARFLDHSFTPKVDAPNITMGTTLNMSGSPVLEESSNKYVRISATASAAADYVRMSHIIIDSRPL